MLGLVLTIYLLVEGRTTREARRAQWPRVAQGVGVVQLLLCVGGEVQNPARAASSMPIWSASLSASRLLGRVTATEAADPNAP